MSLFKTDSQNPLGLNKSSPEICRATMRGGAGIKGQIVYFDIPAGDGGTTASTNFGAATSPTANVLLATATHNGVGTAGWITGVLMDDVADDQQVNVCYRGVVQALGGDTTAVGLKVAPDATSRLALVITKGQASALMLETNAAQTATAGSGTAGKWVIFDGVNGLGGYVA